MTHITDRESIKKISFDHCVKVLSKKKIRENDKEDLKHKEENHDRIMSSERKTNMSSIKNFTTRYSTE